MDFVPAFQKPIKIICGLLKHAYFRCSASPSREGFTAPVPHSAGWYSLWVLGTCPPLRWLVFPVGPRHLSPTLLAAIPGGSSAPVPHSAGWYSRWDHLHACMCVFLLFNAIISSF